MYSPEMIFWKQQRLSRRIGSNERQRLKWLLSHTNGNSFLILNRAGLLPYAQSMVESKDCIQILAEPLRAEHTQDIVSEYQQLGVGSESVQIVIAPHVLEQSENIAEILSEIWRVLMPNGMCFLLFYNRSFWAKYVLGNRYYRGMLKVCPKTPYSEQKQCIKKQGFTVIHAEGLMNHLLNSKTFLPVWSALGLVEILVVQKQTKQLHMQPLNKDARKVAVNISGLVGSSRIKGSL